MRPAVTSATACYAYPTKANLKRSAALFYLRHSSSPAYIVMNCTAPDALYGNARVDWNPFLMSARVSASAATASSAQRRAAA